MRTYLDLWVSHFEDLRTYLGLRVSHFEDLRTYLGLRVAHFEDLRTYLGLRVAHFEDLRTYLGLVARFEDMMASSQNPRDPAPLLALLLAVEFCRAAFPHAPSLAQWDAEAGRPPPQALAAPRLRFCWKGTRYMISVCSIKDHSSHFFKSIIIFYFKVGFLVFLNIKMYWLCSCFKK